MKKLICSLLLLVFFSQFTYAQQGQHTVGIQGGTFLNRTLTARAYPNAQIDISPAAGIFYRYQFHKRLSANAGLLFQKEYDESIYNFLHNENNLDGLQFKMRHNYVNAPLHVVFHLNPKEAAEWRFNLVSGISLQKYLGSNIAELNDGKADENWVKYKATEIDTFAEAGLEVARIINGKYSVSFNPGYRYQLFEDYRDKGFYGLLKFGRIF